MWISRSDGNEIRWRLWQESETLAGNRWITLSQILTRRPLNMSFILEDQPSDMGYNAPRGFLFNASEAIKDASLSINNTLEFLDFANPKNSQYTYGDYDEFKLNGNGLDEQQLNAVLRDNFLTYANPKTILLICLYVPVFIAALVGNVMVLMVILPNRHMRNVTNCFIVNLAVADLLVTLICMPMAIGQSVHKLWLYGEVMCKMTTYMQGVSVSASVFTLMFLSVDRFLAIRHPLTFRSFSTFRYAVCILVSLWLISAGTMIPLMLVRQVQVHTFPIANHVDTLNFCTEVWDHEHGRKIYDTFLFVFMFVIPGCLICTSYSLIGCKLWTEKQSIHRRDSQVGREQTEKVMTARRRVARMLAALAVVFACCWLPYHLHSLYLDFVQLHAVTAIEALPFTILLGHTNSALNPILYCFMNKSFRKAAARLLRIKSRHSKKSTNKEQDVYPKNPVNVVVRYQVTNMSTPVAMQLVPRPTRTCSISTSGTHSRSTISSRISRSSTRSSNTSYRSVPTRDTREIGLCNMYTSFPVTDRILQQETYPSKQLLNQHRPKPKPKPKPKPNSHEDSNSVKDPPKYKKEMFNYTISIPTTIQEETSRGSRSVSPMVERISYGDGRVDMRDTTFVQYEEQKQLPAKVVTSVLKSQNSRYNSKKHSHDIVLDQIDIEIHVPSDHSSDTMKDDSK